MKRIVTTTAVLMLSFATAAQAVVVASEDFDGGALNLTVSSVPALDGGGGDWFGVGSRNAWPQGFPSPGVPFSLADDTVIGYSGGSPFPTDAEARLVRLLRDARHLTVSLVAETDGAIVGHVAFSPVSAGGTGLAPVAVLEAHRRRGIAARLIEAGLAECRARGIGWAVVLGEPAYYRRFGFRAASAFGLSDEYGGGEAFQALELIAGSLPVGMGLVRYGPEFAMFG